jgi:hypothetical protein
MSYTLATLATRTRRILHSYTQINWEDTTIYEYLNEGYVNFGVRSECLRKETSVTLTADTSIQTLPTDTITIYRAEWDSLKVAMTDTHTMDMTYGDGWRTTTGEIVENILQDNEDAGKFRIYPILDTEAIGTTKLKLIHSYIPAEIVSPWTTALSIPIIYQVNLSDYAIYRCLYEQVQSDRNIPLADRHYDLYMDAVMRCRKESFESKLFDVEGRVKHRRFV